MNEDHNMIQCPKCYIWRPKEIKECEHCARMYGTGFKGNTKQEQNIVKESKISTLECFLKYGFLWKFIPIRFWKKKR